MWVRRRVLTRLATGVRRIGAKPANPPIRRGGPHFASPPYLHSCCGPDRRSPQAAAGGDGARVGLLGAHEGSGLVGEADDGVLVVRTLVRLEGLLDRVLFATCRPEPRSQAHAHEVDPWWRPEIHGRLVAQRSL